MNFQQITINHDLHPLKPPINRRIDSLSSESSGIDDLIDNVLISIEEHEEKYQTKLFNSNVYNAHNHSTSRTSSASSQSLPLSTTELATETKLTFITHHKHQPPQISHNPQYYHQTHNNYAQPHGNHHNNPQPHANHNNYQIFSPNPFYPGQPLPVLVPVSPANPPNINPYITPQSPVISLHSAHSVHSAHSAHSAHSSDTAHHYANIYASTQSLPQQRLSTSVSPPANAYIHKTIATPASLSQQRLSMLSNHSHHSVHRAANKLPPIEEDPLSKMEKVFRDRDDTNDGHLDMEEFEEAIHEIDAQINENELLQIFQHIAGKRNEISIVELINYIKNEQKSARGASVTPTILLRGAFPHIFGDINDEDHREIWGDAQTSSIHKLEKELQEEAENEGVIDFPEFEAAINNFGIKLTKAQNEKLFAHFLGEQDANDKKMGISLRRYDTDQIMLGIDKKYELKLAFLMDVLKDNVENHQHLQPKQILKLAFMELLMNCDNLNQQSSFLMKNEEITIKLMKPEEVHNEDDEDEDSFQENPDFDTEIMIIHDTNEAEELQENMLDLPKMGSLGKGDRSLMRMGSSQHWTDDDVIRQQEEMEQHLTLMMMQQNQSGYHL